jgi:O-antigen ligase/tetratricopeptide (TPR) repeat protein
VGTRWDAGAVVRGLLILHLTLSPLLFWTGLLDEFELVKVALLLVAALLLAAVGLSRCVSAAGPLPRAGWWLDVRRWLARDPVALGVLCVLGSAALSTAASISPRLSLVGDFDSYGGLVTILGYAVLYFATRAWCRRLTDLYDLLGAAAAAAAVTSSYALLQVLRADPLGECWPTYVRPPATMGNANFLAAYLAMVFPGVVLFCARAARRRQWWVTAGLAVIGLMSCLAVIATLSRAGWLALGCAVLVLLAAWGGRRALRTLVVTGAGFAALLGLTAFILNGTSPFWHEAFEDGVARLHEFTESPSRLAIWGGGLRVFQSHPWVGAGLDTFRIAFAEKQGDDFWQAEWGVQPSRAHNEAIQVLATQGLVGMAAGLLLLWGIVRVGVRAWRRSGGDRPLVAALLAGLAAFVVQDFFCFTVASCGALFVTLAALLSRLGEGVGDAPDAPPADPRPLLVGLVGGGVLAALIVVRNAESCGLALTPGLLLGCAAIVLICLAVVWGVCRMRSTEAPTLPVAGAPLATGPVARAAWRPGPLLAVGLIWGTAVLVIVLGVVPALRASAACRRGWDQLNAVPARACPDLQAAVELAPWNDMYWLRLGIAQFNAAQVAAQPAEKLEFLGEAQQSLVRAVTLEPERGSQRIWLGRVLAELAARDRASAREAYAHLDRGLRRESRNAYFYADACTAALTLRDWDRAREYAQTCARIYPQFGPARAQLGHVALMEERYADTVDEIQQALQLNWYDRHTDVPVALVSLARALLELGRFYEAGAVSYTAAAALPSFPEPHLFRAVALDKLGNKSEAAIEYQHFLSLRPGPP